MKQKLMKHCLIEFNLENRWVFRDGYKNKDDFIWKNSTNASWLYLSEDTQIFDGMIIKTNSTLFKVINYIY